MYAPAPCRPCGSPSVGPTWRSTSRAQGADRGSERKHGCHQAECDRDGAVTFQRTLDGSPRSSGVEEKRGTESDRGGGGRRHGNLARESLSLSTSIDRADRCQGRQREDEEPDLPPARQRIRDPAPAERCERAACDRAATNPGQVGHGRRCQREAENGAGAVRHSGRTSELML
jgi:hypothetical protein